MLEVRANYNRHVVCVFNRGPRVTYYIGLEGVPQLAVFQKPNEEFDREYNITPKKKGVDMTPLDFALAYTRDASAMKMIPISPTAVRVLTAIMKGQTPEAVAESQTLNSLENLMASTKEDTGFRKPDGPVAQVHKYLDGRIEGIKAGTVSRKECIEKMVEKGISEGTAVTQCGVWARNNGVNFARPNQAAEAKKDKRASASKKKKVAA
jgi:hypothetical protein